MPDISTDDTKKSMEQPDNDLPETMGQPSVNSDEISVPPKNLCDMPEDIVAFIIQKSDYKEQLILRKTSKTLRELVDKQKPACRSVGVINCGDAVYITFSNHDELYTSHAYDNYFKNQYIGRIVERDDFKKVAFDDLASTLKNPRLELEEFSVTENSVEDEDLEKCYNEIQCVMESLNHQVSVKGIKLDVLRPQNIISVLPYLKPGFLENISLRVDGKKIDRSSYSVGMDEVALLEQWKQAEQLQLRNSFDSFPMKCATHFERFFIRENFIDSRKLARIRDSLSNLDNFKYCILSYYKLIKYRNTIHRSLGTLVHSDSTEKVYHYPIPDSDYYFEFRQTEKARKCEIERKKRENE